MARTPNYKFDRMERDKAKAAKKAARAAAKAEKAEARKQDLPVPGEEGPDDTAAGAPAAPEPDTAGS